MLATAGSGLGPERALLAAHFCMGSFIVTRFMHVSILTSGQD